MHCLQFTLNGENVKEWNIDPEETLLYYLRNRRHLLGCKLGCGEGGCGACTVAVSSKSGKFISVNACIFPLTAIHGRHIYTVEAIDGEISQKMTELHASQCGFCTPGFVMSMWCAEEYSDIEDVLSGNLCRCTGYRPIYEAFGKLNLHAKTVDECRPSEMVVFHGQRITWYTPIRLEELVYLKAIYPDAAILSGNSEIGIDLKYKNLIHRNVIFPYWIKELEHIRVADGSLVIGASSKLQELKDLDLSGLGKFENEQFKLRGAVVLKDMLHWFAGRQIRNVASIAGNIITASPISDILPILYVLEARVFLQSAKSQRSMEIKDFIVGYRKTLIDPKEVLVSISIPLTRECEFCKAYKQAKRKDDDISIVTAAFKLVKFGDKSQRLLCSFGGIDSKSRFYEFFEKDIRVDAIYESVLGSISPRSDVPGGMPEYKLALIKSFIQKFFREIRGSTPNQVSRLQQKFQNTTIVGPPIRHTSGLLHCSGSAEYLDDIPKLSTELFAIPILSTSPHAKVIRIDSSKAKEAFPNVMIVTEDDVPGSNTIGAILNDEQIFHSKMVSSIGQIMAMIIAKDYNEAFKASKLVSVEYENLPFILTIEEAIQQNSFFDTERVLKRGGEALDKAKYKSIEGSVKIHGQEHFYLEPQGSLVIPREDFYELYSSTQNPTEGQHFVAKALGIPQAQVQCKVKRIGGGFGGKESRASLLAAALATCAHKSKRPVRCILDRDQDFCFSGHRHSFRGDYKVAIDENGKIHFLELFLYSNGGYSTDLSIGVLERAMAHADGGYHIPNVLINGKICRTNTPSNTAFRGFGGPQGMFIMETIISHISKKLGFEREDVQRTNLLQEGQMTAIGLPAMNCSLTKMWVKCREKVLKDYGELSKELKENELIDWSMVPTKFGIAFGVRHLNQASALVHLQRDGSVLISHGGIEMGQGIHTKISQIAAFELGVPIEHVKIKETCTSTIANSSATAASASTDMYGYAVIDACTKLKAKLDGIEGETFAEKVDRAYFERIDLSERGFHKTEGLGYNWKSGQGRLFSYFTFGVSGSIIKIDKDTGDYTVAASHIIMDLGSPINAPLDIGQIEGAFIQGMGLMTREELLYSPKDGRLITKGPGTYKIPSISDIPKIFTVELETENSRSEGGVLSSRAVGEPPLFLAASVFFAIREAIQQTNPDYFRLDSPATPEAVKMAIERVGYLEGDRWAIRI